mgnify:CR=1 FL=1
MAFLQRLCFQEYCLASPEIILWAIPIIISLAILLLIDFVQFRTKEEKKAFKQQRRIDKIVFFILRSLLFLTLLLAFATPYRIQETTTQGNPSLSILADNSSSMELFEGGIAEGLKEQLEPFFPVTLKYIAQGQRSAIGDGILQNIKGDDNILLVSDGNANEGRDLGDIMLFSSILNTTISTVKMEPVHKDVGIVIEGPNEVIVRSEAFFTVTVHNIGDLPYSLEVFVDGDLVNLGGDGKFVWRFSEGFHKIHAMIKPSSEDYFPQNNEYLMTVKAVPRPSILYVGKPESPFGEALERIYAVTTAGSLPDTFDQYHLVVLNNINADNLNPSAVDRLSNFVSEKGKGLFVVGGDHAFDKGNYKSSYLESILPVQVGVGQRTNISEVNVIMVIDISDSTGWSLDGKATRLELQKAIALDAMDQINLDNNLGVIAFHTQSVLIAPLNRYTFHDPVQLRTKISSLTPGSGTNIYSGLFRAEQEFRRSRGSKNIILISDGQDSWESGILKKGQELANQGIRIYTVGSAGKNTNKALMQRLADMSNGFYYEPETVNKLKLLFGESPEERCEKETMELFILDGSHWITKGIDDFKAKLTGYNFIVPKASGRKLVATDCDRPMLIAGRYGLGRVIVLGTDDGSKWAGQLLGSRNSKVLTKSVNWAIGDFMKDADLDIRVRDTSLGEPTAINIISEEQPQIKGLDFVKVDVGKWSAQFAANETGFFKVLDAYVAVNNDDEYMYVGLNPQLKDLVAISGGRVFDKDDIEGIKNGIISLSRRVKAETKQYRMPLLAIAVIIFLADILFRKFREHMRL